MSAENEKCSITDERVDFEVYRQTGRNANDAFRLSVSKKSTRFWTGMPLARKSKIFGLRSVPANTTPVSLKNRYILRFFAYKVFFRRACQRKNRKCSISDERVDFEIYRQTEAAVKAAAYI